MGVAGSGSTIRSKSKLAFGSSDLARIELTAPDPVCRVSAALIKHVTLSLRNIEHGRDRITDFIFSPRWTLHPKPIGLDGAGFRDRMRIEGLAPSMSIR